LHQAKTPKAADTPQLPWLFDQNFSLLLYSEENPETTMSKQQVNFRLEQELVEQIESKPKSVTTFVTDAVKRQLHDEVILEDAISAIRQAFDSERATFSRMCQAIERERQDSTNDIRADLRELRQEIRSMRNQPSLDRLATSDDVLELVAVVKNGVVVLALLMLANLALILIHMGWIPLQP
jgi:hypothetical protein